MPQGTTIATVQQDIVDEFSLLDNKQDQYAYIIELGKKMPPLPEAYKTEQNIVKGCQSKVWMQPHLSEAGTVVYEAESDAMIVKGLISLLLRVLSDRSPADILTAELTFPEQIGLHQMLSMNRSNGLAAMMKQMRLYALAYQHQQQAGASRAGA